MKRVTALWKRNWDVETDHCAMDRTTLFEELDKPALSPLPSGRFDLSQWSKARVNIDYHVSFDGNFYSVPYTMPQQAV